MPEPGQIIQGSLGKWVLATELGAGGQGSVWSCYEYEAYYSERKRSIRFDEPWNKKEFLNKYTEALGQPHYAVKFLLDAHDEVALSRLKNEVKALQTIDDPRIIRIHDYRLDDIDHSECPPFYTMDLIPGETLQIVADTKKQYYAKPRDSLTLIRDIARALELVHKQGIVHRDLNERNIFIRADGVPVIIDFGLCYIEKGSRHTLAGERVGNVHFMPPELTVGQIESSKLGPFNDTYSLGKILYYVVSGGAHLPREYHHRNEYDLHQILERVDVQGIYRILDRAICEEIKDRYQDMNQLINAINEEIIEGSDCRYCGEGAYHELTGNDKKALWTLRNPGGDPAFERTTRLYVCSSCGNIQYFWHRK